MKNKHFRIVLLLVCCLALFGSAFLVRSAAQTDNDVAEEFLQRLHGAARTSGSPVTGADYDAASKTLSITLQSSAISGRSAGEETLSREMVWQKDVLNTAHSAEFYDAIEHIQFEVLNDNQKVVNSGTFQNIHTVSQEYATNNVSSGNSAEAEAELTSLLNEVGFGDYSMEPEQISDEQVCYIITVCLAQDVSFDEMNEAVNEFIFAVQSYNFQPDMESIPQVLLEIRYADTPTLIVWADYEHAWFSSRQLSTVTGSWGHP